MSEDGKGGLDDARLLRYSRHILLDELGIEAQERFLAAHVLILGAGGLGAPAAMYLAAAGVGTLTIVDDDVIEASNLQRQILYREEDLGASKADTTRAALLAINHDLVIHALRLRAGERELDQLVKNADVVLDCSDNFATRHALNRACVRHRRALVSGSALRFDGQVSVFDLRDDTSPCYACLFPDVASEDHIDCATMGVFAPLTGMVGSLQAAEALKCMAGIASTLSGRLLLIDALRSHIDEVRFGKDPACPVCASAAPG